MLQFWGIGHPCFYSIQLWCASCYVDIESTSRRQPFLPSYGILSQETQEAKIAVLLVHKLPKSAVGKCFYKAHTKMSQNSNPFSRILHQARCYPKQEVLLSFLLSYLSGPGKTFLTIGSSYLNCFYAASITLLSVYSFRWCCTFIDCILLYLCGVTLP